MRGRAGREERSGRAALPPAGAGPSEGRWADLTRHTSWVWR